MKKKKIVSTILTTTMMLTSFTGCNSKIKKEETLTAGVVVYQDNAVVFLDDFNIYDRSAGYELILNQEESFKSQNIYNIKYKDKDELEEKIKSFVGSDANITYYDEIGKSKTLS